MNFILSMIENISAVDSPQVLAYIGVFTNGVLKADSDAEIDGSDCLRVDLLSTKRFLRFTL